MAKGGAKGQAKGKTGGWKPKTQAAAPVKKQVMKNRITGKVIEWKGKFGWITPDRPVSHPEASKNRGRIFLAQEDVELDIQGVGSKVNFFVYADGKGLGAKNVRPGGGGFNGGAPAKTPAMKGSAATGQKAAPKWTPNWGSAGQATDKNGARQKIGGQRLTGTVSEWKGKFGWIMPSSKVNHPEAQKRGGKIYFGQDDVEQELSGVGATVSFFLYKDKSGLGAMNVRSGKGQGKQAQGKWVQVGKQAQGKQQGKKQLVKNDKLKTKKEPKEHVKLERTRISEETKSGIVISTRRETIAWIRPDTEIDHPKMAESDQKDLFVHKSDIEGDAFPKLGANVVFYVYEDAKGLGAENCSVLEQGDGTLPEHLKAEIEERKKAKAAEKPKQAAGKKGKQAGKKGGAAVKVGSFAKKQVANQKKKKQEKEKGPSGPDLPRTRVTDALVTGEVLHMGKAFGWIKPTDTVEHELAGKHGGKIYLHKNDVTGEVTKGSTVTFHIYADESGLGAEECS